MTYMTMNIYILYYICKYRYRAVALFSIWNTPGALTYLRSRVDVVYGEDAAQAKEQHFRQGGYELCSSH